MRSIHLPVLIAGLLTFNPACKNATIQSGILPNSGKGGGGKQDNRTLSQIGQEYLTKTRGQATIPALDDIANKMVASNVSNEELKNHLQDPRVQLAALKTKNKGADAILTQQAEDILDGKTIQSSQGASLSLADNSASGTPGSSARGVTALDTMKHETDAGNSGTSAKFEDPKNSPGNLAFIYSMYIVSGLGVLAGVLALADAIRGGKAVADPKKIEAKEKLLLDANSKLEAKIAIEFDLRSKAFVSTEAIPTAREEIAKKAGFSADVIDAVKKGNFPNSPKLFTLTPVQEAVKQGVAAEIAADPTIQDKINADLNRPAGTPVDADKFSAAELDTLKTKGTITIDAPTLEKIVADRGALAYELVNHLSADLEKNPAAATEEFRKSNVELNKQLVADMDIVEKEAPATKTKMTELTTKVNEVSKELGLGKSPRTTASAATAELKAAQNPTGRKFKMGQGVAGAGAILIGIAGIVLTALNPANVNVTSLADQDNTLSQEVLDASADLLQAMSNKTGVEVPQIQN